MPDLSADRYVKAGVHLVNGIACLALGRLAVGADAPLGLISGGLAGLSGGGDYGQVADRLARASNWGALQSRFELPGAILGAAAGVGVAWLATGNPLAGYALGVGCAVPCFVNAYHAANGLD